MEVRSPMVDVKALAGCLPAVLYWGCSNWLQSSASVGCVAMDIGKFSLPLTHGGAARPSLVIGGVLDWTREAQHHILVSSSITSSLASFVSFSAIAISLTAFASNAQLRGCEAMLGSA